MRWRRMAEMIPHPHVVPVEKMGRLAPFTQDPVRDGFKIGIHFESLRVNMFREEILSAAMRACRKARNLRIRVDLHHDVVDPMSSLYDPRLVAACLSAVADRSSQVELFVHHLFSDLEFWIYLATLDAFMLPYRFGTHSGLIEACRDLATAAIVPSIGFYSEQSPQYVFPVSTQGECYHQGFEECLVKFAQRGPSRPVDANARAHERDRISERYAQICMDLAG